MQRSTNYGWLDVAVTATTVAIAATVAAIVVATAVPAAAAVPVAVAVVAVALAVPAPVVPAIIASLLTLIPCCKDKVAATDNVVKLNIIINNVFFINFSKN